MNLVFNAMMFAREAHAKQMRKYTGNPYADHLAEVAGIVATVPHDEAMISAAWLHDCVEDCGVTLGVIDYNFGSTIAAMVSGLSDLETGNRAERKAASRARLAACSGRVQTIKCADLISNTSSIVMHDPKFAVTYLEEKRLLLEVLTKADPDLLRLAGAGAGAKAMKPTDELRFVERHICDETTDLYGQTVRVLQQKWESSPDIDFHSLRPNAVEWRDVPIEKESKQ